MPVEPCAVGAEALRRLVPDKEPVKEMFATQAFELTVTDAVKGK